MIAKRRLEKLCRIEERKIARGGRAWAGGDERGRSVDSTLLVYLENFGSFGLVYGARIPFYGWDGHKYSINIFH
jgi:hypothetical protein